MDAAEATASSALAGTDAEPLAVRLVADPSPPLLTALFTLCQHLHQAGSFTVRVELVRALLASFGDAMLPSVAALVATAITSDKAALQLLFDLHFLQAVVAPAWAGTPAEAAAAEQLRQLTATLSAKVRVDRLGAAERRPC